MEFQINKYGKLKKLRIGQKVECSYYYEYLGEKEAYKRKWWQLFDLPFKPVKHGVIIGDAGIHPYWLSCNEDGKEQYLKVKFKEYFFAKPIPISCVEDCLESADIIDRLLSESAHRIGEKGYSEDSFAYLTKLSNKARSF